MRYKLASSSLEHLVLEQLFATNGEQGFSAVKAIQVANQEGQKIFTITQDNYQEIIPQLNLAPSAIADIQSAAKAGYTVTTHQNRISLNGYTGEGYIILDSSGNGAWMINGGMYGGFITTYWAIQFTTILTLADWFSTGGRNIIPISIFSNSIFAGLGMANNFLDLYALYDGTAQCLQQIIFAFAIELAMTFMAVTLGLVGAFITNIINIIMHHYKVLTPSCEVKQ